ncbi:uncharacterized protein LOC119388173 [Rhipicephalus sanguineus]|uniref:uncharacterized protein LOC119388173 n=1 Tax=Rhipicephalus sanguineus TaxID=34632 RepID=UPI00189560C4|nr:uncharacterized protein LOC119388173 [Rhipicephalus sanguineus]
MTRQAAEQTGDQTRGRLRLADQSLIDRGYAISCVAATTLRYIRSSIHGDTRGASAMWMPHARDHDRDGNSARSPPSLVQEATCSCLLPAVCLHLRRAYELHSRVSDAPMESWKGASGYREFQFHRLAKEAVVVISHFSNE